MEGSSGGGGGGGGATLGSFSLSGGGGGSGVDVGDAGILRASSSSRCRKKKDFERCIKKENATHSPLKPKRMPGLGNLMHGSLNARTQTTISLSPSSLATIYYTRTMSHDKVCHHVLLPSAFNHLMTTSQLGRTDAKTGTGFELNVACTFVTLYPRALSPLLARMRSRTTKTWLLCVNFQG